MALTGPDDRLNATKFFAVAATGLYPIDSRSGPESVPGERGSRQTTDRSTAQCAVAAGGRGT